jgi:signal transduction histidine kinase
MSKELPFRVQSHVLRLLGDELIGHDRLAVFELVKNAYDADATEVVVTLALDQKDPYISVTDNGKGMSVEIIENAWLEIGTDSKRGAAKKQRTPLGRLPLGEKGVGRLAVQKLGNEIRLTTRQKAHPEYHFEINWEDLISSGKYLGSGQTVSVEERATEKKFLNTHGTEVEIRGLYRTDWSRRDVRDLYRLVTSLCNPFKAVDSFFVDLKLPGKEREIEDLPSLEDMISSAIWQFHFTIDEKGTFDWEYLFAPPKFKGLEHRKNSGSDKLALLEPDPDDLQLSNGVNKSSKDEKIFLDSNLLKGIGPISGSFYAFYRRDEILKASGAPLQIKKWLDGQTGVRVYRDDIRVFNYGEPGDDWLGLNAKRINRPAGKLGTQSLIAQISLTQQHSTSLNEKTNREGFDENYEFRQLRRITQSIFEKFHNEHASDRGKIEQALKNVEQAHPPKIEEALSKLEHLAKTHKIEKEVSPIIASVQNELKTYRDVMVESGLAGTNLALVFHEVVHSIDRVQRKVNSVIDVEDIRQEMTQLRKLLDTFKPLLERDPGRKVSAKDLITRAINLHEGRFARHSVVISNWAADPKYSHEFSKVLPRGLLVGAISNIIDNAIYWTRFRKERDETKSAAAILTLSYWDEETGGMIAIVDNGPGFQLSAEQLGKPFASTKPGGMGLGVYFCKMVMENIGGKLEVMHVDQLRELIEIPAAYDGAAVVLTFKK